MKKIIIRKVKEIELLRRMEEKKNKINIDGFELKNFYEEDLFDGKKLNVLFLIRIFWCCMKDLDNEKKGYDVLEWDYENYYKFFCDNIDKVDLNKNSYRLYFKKLVSYYKNELEKKLKNDE